MAVGNLKLCDAQTGGTFHSKTFNIVGSLIKIFQKSQLAGSVTGGRGGGGNGHSLTSWIMAYMFNLLKFDYNVMHQSIPTVPITHPPPPPRVGAQKCFFFSSFLIQAKFSPS